MSDDEITNFIDAMGGVKPISSPRRVPRQYQVDTTPGAKRRREAASAELGIEINALSGGNSFVDGVEQVDPVAVLQYRRDGIQNTVYRKLRQGKYPVEARLDLHHQSVEQARSLVLEFIRDCREHDLRCVLITHGKGEGREQPARLKSCVAHWLPQLDEVLAFHSAEPEHGGTGATYILLRKAVKTADDFY